MKIDDRLKTYVAFTDVSRRWILVMDAKAAFLSALNGGLLAFLWSGAKLLEWHDGPRYIGITATGAAMLALVFALWVITPRETLSSLVGRRTRWTAEYKPFSFYGYIARKYNAADFDQMESDLATMDEAAFAHESLEQHFAISRVIQAKSEWVFRAAMFTLVAIISSGIGLMFEMIC